MNQRNAHPMQDPKPNTMQGTTPGFPPVITRPSGLLSFVPWIAAGLAILAMTLAVAKAMRPVTHEGLPIDEIARLPVSASGRTKPLDSFARSSLLRLSGRQTFEIDAGDSTEAGARARRAPAIQWLLEVWTDPTKAMDRRVIRIDHPDVLAVLGLSGEKRTRFSLNEVLPKSREIEQQAQKASDKSAKSRDPFERHILDLYSKLVEFASLANFDAPYAAAPLAAGEEWRPLSQPFSKNERGEGASAAAWMSIRSAYSGATKSQSQTERAVSIAECREAVAAYAAQVAAALPSDTKAAHSEVIFNRVQPFYQASVLYVVAFLLGAVALLLRPLSHGASTAVSGVGSGGAIDAGNGGWSRALVRAALAVVAVAFVAHSLGLVARIWLQGRPPVTNLYSSAVFIGWACVPVALVGEWFQRHGLLTLAASMIGFSTLVIAHNLGSSGDTMEMMQAVLDSNFWLATHVVVVTIGYSATFLAGLLAAMYVLLGIPTRLLTGEPMKALPKMTYGVICFATIASFVGTVLGGIWADQSWGRFWGWDPKENGAAMIVLWNLLILHARWGGMIKERGVAVLAVGGNIITAWSWFGTNMLGVGLHSYGFMDSAAFYMIVFVVSQLAIMGLALAVPRERWTSLGAATQGRPRVILAS